MNAFEKINSKPFVERSVIEKVIVWFCEYDQNEYPITKVSPEAELAAEELARLQAIAKAAEEMAERLKNMRRFKQEVLDGNDTARAEILFDFLDAEALAAYEAAKGEQ